MPYANPDVRREYMRRWIAQRRAEWFADKECARCAATEELRLDHIDPSQKVSHRIWSWAKERREAELAKCQVLCEPCHKLKTKENSEHARGLGNGNAHLTTSVIHAVRTLAASMPQAEIARVLGLNRKTVYDIVHRRTWQHI